MNRTILIGRLTKDVDLRYTQDGKAIARFTLAIDRGFGDKKTTDFISCVAFGKTAETAGSYLSKGRRAAVDGSIKTGSYEKDGRTVYTFDVWADRIEFVDSKPQEGQSTTADKSDGGRSAAPVEGFNRLTDEDIPF